MFPLPHSVGFLQTCLRASSVPLKSQGQINISAKTTSWIPGTDLEWRNGEVKKRIKARKATSGLIYKLGSCEPVGWKVVKRNAMISPRPERAELIPEQDNFFF